MVRVCGHQAIRVNDEDKAPISADLAAGIRDDAAAHREDRTTGRAIEIEREVIPARAAAPASKEMTSAKGMHKGAFRFGAQSIRVVRLDVVFSRRRKLTAFGEELSVDLRCGDLLRIVRDLYRRFLRRFHPRRVRRSRDQVLSRSRSPDIERARAFLRFCEDGLFRLARFPLFDTREMVFAPAPRNPEPLTFSNAVAADSVHAPEPLHRDPVATGDAPQVVPTANDIRSGATRLLLAGAAAWNA